MKKVNVTMYESDDGRRHATPTEAEIADMENLLASLDVAWREGAGSLEIAQELYAEGYTITRRPIVESAQEE